MKHAFKTRVLIADYLKDGYVQLIETEINQKDNSEKNQCNCSNEDD